MYAEIERAREAIAARARVAPRVGIILGSGLGALAEGLDDAVTVPYGEIPGFPTSTVAGHRGEMVLGRLAGRPVAAMRGRFHFYEGYSMGQVTFPVRVMRALGCATLIVTNAAGGLRADWPVGSLMRIVDHIFLPGLAGHHPLRGPNDERLGPRFPPMADAYDRALGGIAHAVSEEQGVGLRDGVYAMVAGPSFETGAEVRMCRALGADAVGMSTAPEVVVARHGGMRVLGISLITNQALPEAAPSGHDEVLAASAAAVPAFAALLTGIVARLPSAE